VPLTLLGRFVSYRMPMAFYSTLALFAQNVTYVLPNQLEENGVQAAPMSKRPPSMSSYDSVQNQRLSSCPALAPYLIGVVNSTENRITAMVLKLSVFIGSDLARVGVNEMRYGTTGSRLLIIGARSDVSTFLNPNPVPVGLPAKDNLCEDSLEMFRSNDPTERFELKLDSITFADGSVLGEDSYGVIERSEKRALATKDFVSRLRALQSANNHEVQAQLSALLSSTSKAIEVSPRHKLDFYSQEMFALTKAAIREIQNGQTPQHIEGVLSKHLQLDATKLTLRRKTQ
jgi:hypothetical protein